MQIHVLPGDSLVEIFKQTEIEGEIAVCRECLVDGDLLAKSLEDFWRVREHYLSSAYPEAEKSYSKSVKAEFEKLLNLEDKSEVYLWFEHELFCQANMWFCLYLLQNSEAEIYRVEPCFKNAEDVWKGFGNLETSDLPKCFAARKKFSDKDIKLGADLWKAFQNKDFGELEKLSQTNSECFPHLKEVCRAAIEQEFRPKEVIQKIIADGADDFGKVFRKFHETEGVYGFGDSQVKRIYDEVISYKSESL
jgi:hypothetical protein